MFELPDAKRVRREDLYDSSCDRHSSPERAGGDDAELRAKLNARLSSLLSLDLVATTTATSASPAPTGAAAEPQSTVDDGQPQPADGQGQGQGEGEPEFAFRLFSTSSASQKVVLAADEDGAGFDGAPISQRPMSHYIRGELTPRQREQFRFAAVSAQDVCSWASQRAWGLEVPWRVTEIRVVAERKGPRAVGAWLGEELREGDLTEKKKKKKRPGKKRRIALRKREKARREAEAALEKQMMSKEEHLREKKKRLNREKKLKRRVKEKEKKLAAKAAGGGEGEQGTTESQSEAE